MFWKKDKMLVTSIFSFHQNVCKSLFPRVVKSRDYVVKSKHNAIIYTQYMYQYFLLFQNVF